MIDLARQSPAAAHWSRQQYEDLFVTALSRPAAEHFAWVVEDDRGGLSEKVPIDSFEIIAFLVAQRVDAEWELQNIVVAEKARRQGMGVNLLGYFVAYARDGGGSGIFLEVRLTNRAAQALYGKLGFEETGLRKNYYVSPAEDAILYRLSLR